MAHRPRPKATAIAPAAKLRMCSATATAACLCEVRVFKPATVINARCGGATFKFAMAKALDRASNFQRSHKRGHPFEKYEQSGN